MQDELRVYESPWRGEKRLVALHEPAVQHVQVAETFLKVLAHLPTDERGEITDEALVYSEWRYINYLRFIDAHGVAPCDCPPPWDVALIWYLHLLSPTRFYKHLWNSQIRSDNVFYGLEHRHFPFSELAKGEWSPSITRRAWDNWSSLTGGRRGGPNLTYQLWPSPPWQEAPRRRSSLFSALFNRHKIAQPGPQKLLKAPQEKEAPRQLHLEFDRPIIMQPWNCCSLGGAADLPATWDIASYTNFRTWRRADRCRNQSQHEAFRQQCELTPWPSVQDLRADLNRQIPFWKVLTQTASSQPGFAEGIEGAVKDYEAFIGLFNGKFSKTTPYVSRIDPKAPARRLRPRTSLIPLVPPTLEVDLLWHTHRLFPGKYWLWSSIKAGWMIEYQSTTNAAAAEWSLGKTRSEWETRLGSQCPRENGLDTWFAEYVPDAAKFASEDAETRDLKLMILGYNPWKGRRHKRTRDFDGTGGGGGAGDYCGPTGDGGGGGGDGGGGGE